MALAFNISVLTGKQTSKYLGHKVMVSSQPPSWQCCITSIPGSNTQLFTHSMGRRLAYSSTGLADIHWTWAQASDQVPACAICLSPFWISSDPGCAQFKRKPSHAGPFQASTQGLFTSTLLLKESHMAKPKVKV